MSARACGRYLDKSGDGLDGEIEIDELDEVCRDVLALPIAS